MILPMQGILWLTLCLILVKHDNQWLCNPKLSARIHLLLVTLKNDIDDIHTYVVITNGYILENKIYLSYSFKFLSVSYQYLRKSLQKRF